VQSSSEFPAFVQMLIDIGVIGRVVSETEFYVEAEFDYHFPGQLKIPDDEEICLHPVFSGRNFRRRGNDKKFVYPYGSDPSAESD
jgi:hypothetical protein